MKLIEKRKHPGHAYVLLLIFGISSVLSAQTDSSRPFPQLLFPAFTRSILIMKSGQKNSALLNYNTVDEEMVFKQNGIYLVLEKPEDIDTIFMQNCKFVPVGKVFYEVVVKGPVSLYIQHKSHYVPVGTNTAYGLTSQTNGPAGVLTAQTGNQIRSIELPPNMTVSPTTAYWVKRNNEMNKFTNERQFLKIFPEKEKEIKEFIKNSKLDLKLKEDLIKLGNFCNEQVK
ncbi:MAG: hypothetical protein WA816_16135 [Bacteroidales bacterium]